MLLIGRFILPRDADVTSLRREFNWQCSRQHAIFISPCRFDHSTSGVNVKYMYHRVGGTPLIVGSHQSQIYTNRSRWNGRMHYLDYYVVFSRSGPCISWPRAQNFKSFRAIYARFPVVSLYFSCLLPLVKSTATTAIFNLCPNQSHASFEVSRHDNTSGQFHDSCFCITNESVCDYRSRTLYANNVDEDSSYLKTELYVHNASALRLIPWTIWLTS